MAAREPKVLTTGAPKFDKPPTRFQGPCPECGGTGGHRGTCSHSGLKPANPSLSRGRGEDDTRVSAANDPKRVERMWKREGRG